MSHPKFPLPSQYCAYCFDKIEWCSCNFRTEQMKENQKQVASLFEGKNAKIDDRDPNVDHPDHYNAGEFEVIDVIADAGFGEGFCLGNALKYILRAKHKVNYQEDLKKAEWYLNWWNEYLKTHVP